MAKYPSFDIWADMVSSSGEGGELPPQKEERKKKKGKGERETERGSGSPLIHLLLSFLFYPSFNRPV